MAYYLVHAQPLPGKLPNLCTGLDSGEIAKMHPFGRALDLSLRGARWEGENLAIWEEEDYCRPPLAQEGPRSSTIISPTYKSVEPGQGWTKIEKLPGMWAEREDDTRP